MAVRLDRADDLEKTVQRCTAVQKEWRVLPAPVRGEIVRRIGEAFREPDAHLGFLAGGLPGLG